MAEEIGAEASQKSPSSVMRRQIGSRRRSRIGEATGECAAVCCCCPCAVMHVVLMAVYRIPRSLWKGRKKRNIALEVKKEGSAESGGGGRLVVEEELLRGNDVVVDWDKEMLERFGSLGFFRSDSVQGETVS
ncbi:uncharacterized protein LOC127253847 [Andrographis paniculata]|uniref:uncharacterized protein LOC127253847 n=1 Tax=Andrographis paniculata TaxID=175694 RepID=UPI0021E99932|nr:uncharacterized protein LOC127253847 [Andrographis paniculata]